MTKHHKIMASTAVVIMVITSWVIGFTTGHKVGMCDTIGEFAEYSVSVNSCNFKVIPTND